MEQTTKELCRVLQIMYQPTLARTRRCMVDDTQLTLDLFNPVYYPTAQHTGLA